MAFDLERIDWNKPWLFPVASLGQRVAKRVQSGLSVAQALNEAAVRGSACVTFVPQSALPQDHAYENFIFETGNCPTRDGLHDFFNGLMWISFPNTKKKLNSLQAEQIRNNGVSQSRGKVRDALTLFDENVAFLRAPDSLWNALKEKDWKALFVQRRALWNQSQLILFGHALLEKLVSPRMDICAHVFRVESESDDLENIDQWIDSKLSASLMATKPFIHLPVLGVPGWCKENESEHFYENRSVFRFPRK